MAKVVLLQPLASISFCIRVDSIVECTEAESLRLIRGAIARPLRSHEPTQDQVQVNLADLAPPTESTEPDSEPEQKATPVRAKAK
jgi:hypothetical protein